MSATRPLDRTPWESHARHHGTARNGSDDWGEWHKRALDREHYAMNLDGVEFRAGPNGIRIVGLVELIFTSHKAVPGRIEGAPEALPPWPGKEAVLRLFAQSHRDAPVFLVWHRGDFSVSLVAEVEHWRDPRYRIVLDEAGLATLIRRLPDFPAAPPTCFYCGDLIAEGEDASRVDAPDGSVVIAHDACGVDV